jgi:hypothetical protein
VEITNCHMHTFTNAHVPDRYVPRIVGRLLQVAWFRDALLTLVRLLDRGRRTRVARYARILEVSYDRSQEAVFLVARGFYPSGTRFVVLPMEMTFLGAGKVEETLSAQHAALAKLAKDYPGIVIPGDRRAARPRPPRPADALHRSRQLRAHPRAAPPAQGVPRTLPRRGRVGEVPPFSSGSATRRTATRAGWPRSST